MGCEDVCPATGRGVVRGCQTRFAFGTNWAWRNFGGDFGGVTSFGWKGVSQNRAEYAKALAQMKAAGVNVIRWWMFPRFRTDSIVWGTDGAPERIQGTLAADVQAALQLAAEHDVYLMPTLFSFDSFYPSATDAGLFERSLKPMVVNAQLRAKLIKNLLVPVASAAKTSPHAERLLAWDLINEPEWAMRGNDLYGTEPFDSMDGLETVTHSEMELFLKEVAEGIRSASSALITVGGSAIKWPRAWKGVGVDFYQLHYYDWVYEWYPYKTVTLSSVGLTDKPVVLGEFPAQGLSAIPSRSLPARTSSQYTADLWSQGYAGALSWSFEDDGEFPFNAAELKNFHEQHVCETQFTESP